jgi:hypothetical protein
MELPVKYDDLTPHQRKVAREGYRLLQDDNCHFCGAPLSGDPIKVVQDRFIEKRLFPVGFFKHPIHLHHDRKTGLTKGAVHARCNAYLWQYRGQ